jgi:hypothetical protein
MNYTINQELKNLEEEITGVFLTKNVAEGSEKWRYCRVMGDRVVSYYLSPDWEPNCTSHLPREMSNYIPFPDGKNLRLMKRYPALREFKKKYNLI